MRPLRLAGAVTLAAVLCAPSLDAADVIVASDIAVSTTWTADNTYDLRGQVYVLPGATLTIEAGTVIASTPGFGGSLVVARDAQIFVRGTQDAPVIMTSTADVATWSADPSHPTGGDPTTGVWRQTADEWGNLTILGRALIATDAFSGNVPTCDAGNIAVMEGLAPNGSPGTRFYGGGDDDDDSGTIEYLSLRYGGSVFTLNEELNGLSLGGVGRCTDVHHVEVMNNLDDGIEIWGGTVSPSHFAIWNVGDDGLDVDQGWRGSAQFGLLVQGCSLNDLQGFGMGDNCVELDGAENSDWQPVTTATLANLTVIGQPVDGDGATAWRDGARVQIHNSVFMDCGEQVVRFDDTDGDGGQGYGFGGTLTWPQVWDTPFDDAPPHPNDCPPGTYRAQVSGKLTEIRDSVFFRNLGPNAYTEATARGVFDPTNQNVLVSGADDADAPIAQIVRGGPTVCGGKVVLPVTFLDPRPANDALLAQTNPPENGVLEVAPYRGAFAPGELWTCGWTASEAFGFTPSTCPTTVPIFSYTGGPMPPEIASVVGEVDFGVPRSTLFDATSPLDGSLADDPLGTFQTFPQLDDPTSTGMLVRLGDYALAPLPPPGVSICIEITLPAVPPTVKFVKCKIRRAEAWKISPAAQAVIDGGKRNFWAKQVRKLKKLATSADPKDVKKADRLRRSVQRKANKDYATLLDGTAYMPAMCEETETVEIVPGIPGTTLEFYLNFSALGFEAAAPFIDEFLIELTDTPSPGLPSPLVDPASEAIAVDLVDDLGPVATVDFSDGSFDVPLVDLTDASNDNPQAGLYFTNSSGEQLTLDVPGHPTLLLPPDHEVAFGGLSAGGTITVTGSDGSGDTLDVVTAWTDLRNALDGIDDDPVLEGLGTLAALQPLTLRLTHGKPLTPTTLVVGLTNLGAPFKGGVLVPTPDVLLTGLPTDGFGRWEIATLWPPGIPPEFPLFFQTWIPDPVGPSGLAASNGLQGVAQ